MSKKAKIIQELNLTDEQFKEQLLSRIKTSKRTAVDELGVWFDELFAKTNAGFLNQQHLQTEEKITPRGVDLESRPADDKEGGDPENIDREDFDYVPAKRTDTHMRIALAGGSGSGKTYSSLLLAKTLAQGGKIAVVDTEDNSAALYDHLANFDTLILRPPYGPDRYIKAIKMAEQKNYSVLILDSISHMWAGTGGLLDLVERTNAVSKDQRAGWAKATPLYEEFLETVKNSKMHIICTIRTKTKLLESKEDGKFKKSNDELIMRKEIDYEFTTVLDIDISHLAKASKDRTRIFDTITPQYITEETGQLFLDWLNGKK